MAKKKMTAEEGLKILDERDPITKHMMTRLQNKMSLKEAAKFRRIIRERARDWRRISEGLTTSQMRKAGAKRSRKAKDTPHQGRQAYTLLDAAITIPLNSRSTVWCVLHRYPNGRVFADIRLWGVSTSEDAEVTIVPTKKGVAVPFEKLPYLLKALSGLYSRWKNRLPAPEDE